MDEIVKTASNSGLIKRTYSLDADAVAPFSARAQEDCQRKDSASFILREFMRAYNAHEFVWTSGGWFISTAPSKRKRGDANTKRKT